jgi:phosphotransferase system enzyme I (PtsI)
MESLDGTGAGSGIAIGVAQPLAPHVDVEERHVATDRLVSELIRFEAAIENTDAEMAEAAALARALGPRTSIGAEMVDAHRAILHSDELTMGARRLIRERKLGAEWAVRTVLDEVRGVFERMSDERFRARLADVEAVADRLLRSLLQLPAVRANERLEGKIAVGAELSPLDVLHLHRLGVAGIATERGGPTSHAAILARAVGIPYVFGVAGLVERVRGGELICLDAARGEVVIDPDEEALRRFEQRQAELEARSRAVIAATSHAPAATLCGAPLAIGANVESARDVEAAIAAGADHIGLVRTELLYLGRAILPSEEEQWVDAVEIVRAARGRTVTFRTLDLGGDKLPSGVRIGVGPNPALGLRGIRFSLRRRDLFRTQLRALYRASAAGPVRIMFPLVACVTELRAAREVCRAVRDELAAAGEPHDPHVPLGAMIETPSAVLTADHITSACSFVSVGTNDLVQYAFAADREDAEMAAMYQPHHPTILRALRHVFGAAAQSGCEVSVCGDMAGDPANAWMLIGLGLRSFSMSARQIPFVKSLLMRTAVAEAEQLAADALRLDDPAEIKALARARLGDRFALQLG